MYSALMWPGTIFSAGNTLVNKIDKIIVFIICIILFIWMLQVLVVTPRHHVGSYTYAAWTLQSWHADSGVAAPRLSCSAACGILVP